MENDSYEIIQNMCEHFIAEKSDINKQVKDNENSIKEIDSYLKSIFDKEETDFKFFSPRNLESVYKEDITQKKNEKENFTIINQAHFKRLDEIDLQLNNLQKVMSDILILKRARQSFTDSTERIKKEYLNILDIQEKERKRIADELHDTSLQNMTHLLHMIELSSMFIDQDPARAKLELETTNINLKKIIEEIRQIIFNFRPMSFDDLGLVEAIQNLGSEIEKSNGIKVETELVKPEIKDNVILVTIYRIINECVINAVKHSNCSTIRIKMLYEEKDIVICVYDNGKGFNVREIQYDDKNAHFGLTIMKERVALLGGTLDIQSGKNNGTMVLIKLSTKIE